MWKTVPNIKNAVVKLGQRNYNEVIILIHEGGSNMLKLLVTMPVGAVKDSFLNEETKQLLEQHFDVSYNLMERNYTAEELAEAAKNCTILVTGWGTPHLGQTGLLTKESALKLVAHTGGSVGDLVDHTAFENGITVISGNELYAESTAEGALAYMLTALRHIPDDVANMKIPGYWKTEGKNPTAGLFERQIGIVGVGAVARNLMRFLKPFRVQLKVYDTYTIDSEFLQEVNAVQTDLEDIFRTCSVISIHASLTPHTKGLIGKKYFKLMQENAIFVNSARGAIVVEDELIEALQTQNIRAILDVYTVEPLPAESPLRNLDNAYLVPHHGGPTIDRRSGIGRAICEDVLRFAQGQSLRYEIKAEQAARMTTHNS